MRRLLLALLLLSASGVAVLLIAQEAVRRDAEAVLVAAQSVAAMGGAVPASTSAMGTIQLVEGSLEEFGTIRILTRGADKSREEIQTPSGTRGMVYSDGLAARLAGTGKEEASLELAATSQTPNFPLAILAGALNNADFALEYLGIEDLGGSKAHHIRFWNMLASKTKLQHLAEFTRKDIWVDAATGLPRRLVYDEREAGGASPRIRVEANYSDYRNAGGILYPFLIERVYNGTPWTTIRIASVDLNAAVSDSEFAVE